jgi:hypothetical protein
VKTNENYLLLLLDFRANSLSEKKNTLNRGNLFFALKTQSFTITASYPTGVPVFCAIGCNIRAKY